MQIFTYYNRVSVNIDNNYHDKLPTEPFLCREDQEDTFTLKATCNYTLRTPMLAHHSQLCDKLLEITAEMYLKVCGQG